jgi:hypothetical protein
MCDWPQKGLPFGIPLSLSNRCIHSDFSCPRLNLAFPFIELMQIAKDANERFLQDVLHIRLGPDVPPNRTFQPWQQMLKQSTLGSRAPFQTFVNQGQTRINLKKGLRPSSHR